MASATSRVLEVLRQRPVTIGDWDRQPACDGGNRITRLAARIYDLKQEGYDISSRQVELGDAYVAEYSLVADRKLASAGQPLIRSGEGGNAVDAPSLVSEKEPEKVEVTSARGHLPAVDLGAACPAGSEGAASPAEASNATMDHPSHGDSPAQRLAAPPLPAGVVPVRAHARRIHPDQPAEQLSLLEAA